MQLKNKVFLITGAGSGLGAAVARMAVDSGAKAVLVDVNQPAGEALSHELGDGAAFVKADVTSADEGAAALLVIQAQHAQHAQVALAAFSQPCRVEVARRRTGG